MLLFLTSPALTTAHRRLVLLLGTAAAATAASALSSSALALEGNIISNIDHFAYQQLAFLCTIAVASLVAVSYAGWILWLRPKLEMKKPFPGSNKAPMAEGCNWFTGHAQLLLGSDVERNIRVLAEDSADGDTGLTSFWLGSKPALAVTRWQDADAVLRASYTRDPL